MDIMGRRTIYTLLLSLTGVFLIASSSFAQRGDRPKRTQRSQQERSLRQELRYDNHAYLPHIRTIAFHPEGQESGFPVIYMGQGDRLSLFFDDLRGDVRNFYFSIEHCSADWQPSGLSPLEYAEGFNEDRIDTYRPSIGTLQPYTTYQVEIPSKQVRPKLPGNYLLKVYEDADKRRLILTRRFYVVAPAIDVDAILRPSTDHTRRATHQKLDLTLRTGVQSIPNPHQDLRVVVLQNQRPDVREVVRKPSFISDNEIRYHDSRTLDFPGGNEFRYVDLRSLRLASERMADLWTDSLVHVRLTVDENRSGQVYGSVFDEDGAFFIRNLDRPDAVEEADYAQVTFLLKGGPAPTDVAGDVYVVGGFNAYQRTEENRLDYREDTGLWEVTLPLKQGLYDFDYVYVPRSDGGHATDDTSLGIQPFRFSGSHYQTGNRYQILVYYRRPGTTWDEIRGFRELSTSEISAGTVVGNTPTKK